jgi:non-ribosomal peptide synthase protein (TIGR01720 family)
MDGVSFRIVLEDLQALYGALEAGRAPSLPDKTSSFQAWSRALASYATSPALQAELAYWQAVVSDPERGLDASQRRPGALLEGGDPTPDWIQVELGERETEQLLNQAPRAHQTQINDLLLTALGHSLCEWAGRKSVLMALEGHGREDLFEELDVTRTVGWFTSMYPVRITPDADDLGVSIERTKRELRAVPQKGIGYGVLRYLSPAGQVLANGPEPDVVFNYLGQFDQVFEAEGSRFRATEEPSGASEDPRNPFAWQIGVNSMVVAGRLATTINFNPRRHRLEDIQRLGEHYQRTLRLVVEHCLARLGEAAGPATLPTALPTVTVPRPAGERRIAPVKS